MTRIESYADALRYLYGFADYERNTPRAHDSMRLSSVLALLNALGNPHERLRAIHITGTKGKGSTAAMLTSILKSCGYRTCAYTSPHLHTHRERYRLDGRPVSEAVFTDLVRKAQPVIERVRREHSLTTFEVSTALAFKLFVSVPGALSVIEVGLGGRLDTTNVITPILSAITAVSLDHTEVLGGTLEAIAWEKAGIIKPGIPVVIAPQRNEAMEVILRRSRELHSPTVAVAGVLAATGRQVVNAREQDFTLETELSLGGQPLGGTRVRLGLLGPHQVSNALTAIAASSCLEEAGYALRREGLLGGLHAVRWPGRFEVVQRRVPIIVDGAHNDDSIAQLRATLAEVFPGRKPIYVLGTTRGHDAARMLEQLAGYRVVLCSSTHPRSLPLPELVAGAGAAGLHFETAPSVRLALENAVATTEADLVVVCGSLFVVAEAREALGLAEASDPIRH